MDEEPVLVDNIKDVNGLEYFLGEVKAVDNISFAVRKEGHINKTSQRRNEAQA